MHPAQGTLVLIEGSVTLHQLSIKPMHLKFFLAPGSRKKTPVVLQPFRFNDERTLYFCLGENHEQNLLGGV